MTVNLRVSLLLLYCLVISALGVLYHTNRRRTQARLGVGHVVSLEQGSRKRLFFAESIISNAVRT